MERSIEVSDSRPPHIFHIIASSGIFVQLVGGDLRVVESRHPDGKCLDPGIIERRKIVLHLVPDDEVRLVIVILGLQPQLNHSAVSGEELHSIDDLEVAIDTDRVSYNDGHVEARIWHGCANGTFEIPVEHRTEWIALTVGIGSAVAIA